MLEPPPQPKKPASINDRTIAEKTANHRFLLGPAPRSRNPNANGEAVHQRAFRDLFLIGSLRSALGPAVWIFSVETTVVPNGLTSALDGVKRHVVKAGSGPQLNLTIPSKPLKDFVVIRKVAA